FRILHSWTETRAGTHVTIEDFIAHAESISGRDLGEFFNVWLFTPKRPTLPGPGGPAPPK
ncbi:MAG TPA: hypothetical protein VMZ00_08895, partial [Sporichthya sp.]|nr:hypothetical protein [Sporichthya sp.]